MSLYALPTLPAIKCSQHFTDKRALNIRLNGKRNLMEIKRNGKSDVLWPLHRSPYQSIDAFNNLLSKFEDNLISIISKKPIITCIVIDFNAKSSTRCVNDTLSHEGLEIESLTFYHGLTQVIYESTHLLLNSSFCNDLIFTTQPNLVNHSGTYSSLHKNCTAQKMKFSKKADTLFIQRVFDELNRGNVFSNIDID